jgi:hypothetical protein
MKNKALSMGLLASAVTLSLSVTLGSQSAFAVVTDKDISQDELTPNDVVTYGHGQRGQRFSNLKKVNTKTVKKMVPVWAYSLGGEKQRGHGQLAAVAGMRSRLQWTLATQPAQDITADGLEGISRRSWDIGVAVKQDYRELANEVEFLLDAWVKDGSLAALFAKHKITYQKPSIYIQ